jgi:hypothetical protein
MLVKASGQARNLPSKAKSMIPILVPDFKAQCMYMHVAFEQKVYGGFGSRNPL